LKRDFWLKLEFAVIAVLVLLGLASVLTYAWSLLGAALF
jgi:hypothetical protein